MSSSRRSVDNSRRSARQSFLHRLQDEEEIGASQRRDQALPTLGRDEAGTSAAAARPSAAARRSSVAGGRPRGRAEHVVKDFKKFADAIDAIKEKGVVVAVASPDAVKSANKERPDFFQVTEAL